MLCRWARHCRWPSNKRRMSDSAPKLSVLLIESRNAGGQDPLSASPALTRAGPTAERGSWLRYLLATQNSVCSVKPSAVATAFRRCGAAYECSAAVSAGCCRRGSGVPCGPLSRRRTPRPHQRSPPTRAAETSRSPGTQVSWAPAIPYRRAAGPPASPVRLVLRPADLDRHVRHQVAVLAQEHPGFPLPAVGDCHPGQRERGRLARLDYVALYDLGGLPVRVAGNPPRLDLRHPGDRPAASLSIRSSSPWTVASRTALARGLAAALSARCRAASSVSFAAWLALRMIAAFSARCLACSEVSFRIGLAVPVASASRASIAARSGGSSRPPTRPDHHGHHEREQRPQPQRPRCRRVDHTRRQQSPRPAAPRPL